MNNCLAAEAAWTTGLQGALLACPGKAGWGPPRRGPPAWGPPGHAAGHRHAGQQPRAHGGGRLCRASISSIVSHAQKPLSSPAVSQPASFCACFLLFSIAWAGEELINKYTHTHSLSIYIYIKVCVYITPNTYIMQIYISKYIYIFPQTSISTFWKRVSAQGAVSSFLNGPTVRVNDTGTAKQGSWVF